MISAILSFFGGSVFRMIWGELSAWLTRRQEHAQELDRLRLQGELEAAQHARNLEAIRVQAELGVKTIQVQAEGDIGREDAATFKAGVEGLSRSSGYAFVDVWKGIIQPLLASICIALVVLHFHGKGWVLDERGWELVGGVLGLFIADRLLFRRGK